VRIPDSPTTSSYVKLERVFQNPKARSISEPTPRCAGVSSDERKHLFGMLKEFELIAWKGT
jgi:hypothetical protein